MSFSALAGILRLIYTSNFKLQFRIKLALFREYNFFVCLVNLQAQCEIGLTSK